MELTHRTSLRVYRVVIHIKQSLFDFAFTHQNCILAQYSQWRVTYHAKDFSMNVFNAKKIKEQGLVAIVSVGEKSIEDVLSILRAELFPTATFFSKPTQINWVVKFYTGLGQIDLEQMYDEMSFIGDMIIKKGKKQKKTPPKIQSYNCRDSATDCYEEFDVEDIGDDELEMNINMQVFSALIMKPFAEKSNVTLQVYPTGNLNVTGIPCDSYFDKVHTYINDILVPIMDKSKFVI